MSINFFNSFVNSSAIEKVSNVLTSTFLSEGKLVKLFEERLQQELGIISPISVNSGTSALHLALLVAGISSGDEVICPAQTFIASGLSILQAGAVPIFADIQYETGNISPASIIDKITEKTKAIMPVHWGGYPCDMSEIKEISDRYGLIVIEDAAHALGATYNEKPIGALSDFTCFSFQAIKHLTTGDGGAICCLDPQYTEQMLRRRWFGIDRSSSQLSVLGERRYDVQEIGYKYHLNDYSAALGLANLEGFKDRLSRRIGYAKKYTDALSDIDGITLFKYHSDRQSAYWLYGFHVERRHDFILALKERGVPTSVVHQRIDNNSVFGEARSDLRNQELFDETQIHIPIHDGLKDEDVEHIIESIKLGW